MFSCSVFYRAAYWQRVCWVKMMQLLFPHNSQVCAGCTHQTKNHLQYTLTFKTVLIHKFSCLLQNMQNISLLPHSSKYTAFQELAKFLTFPSKHLCEVHFMLPWTRPSVIIFCQLSGLQGQKNKETKRQPPPSKQWVHSFALLYIASPPLHFFFLNNHFKEGMFIQICFKMLFC